MNWTVDATLRRCHSSKALETAAEELGGFIGHQTGGVTFFVASFSFQTKRAAQTFAEKARLTGAKNVLVFDNR